LTLKKTAQQRPKVDCEVQNTAEDCPTAVEGTVKTKSLGDTTANVGRVQLRTEKARVMARPEPGTVQSGTSLRDALAMMRAQGGDAVLVLHGSGLAGILTERDVLTRVLGSGVDESRPVDEFMTASPGTLHADATLIEAMRSMEQGHFRNLPLVDDAGTVVGLLRQQDLLEYVAEAFPQEILNLPPRPHQLMEEPEGA
jgi:CBS domain-containing protein